MQNLADSYRMLDAFSSVGATHFDVTFLDIDGTKTGFRPQQSAQQMRNSLPKLFPGLTERKQSLVIRPHAKEGVTLVQLDDLNNDALERLKDISFLTLCTSPGNHQAWVAIDLPKTDPNYAPDYACPYTQLQDIKDLTRRLRKGVGADISASGASRIAGSYNYKRKYEPDFPIVSTVSTVCGRVVTSDQLEQVALLAPPEPVRPQVHISPRRVSSDVWPSYEITLSRAPLRRDGTGPDRSVADFNWAMTCLTGRKTIEDTIFKLGEVSENTKERFNRGDKGYARITVENAAAAVERNRQKRSR